jgi:6-phosphofructokinase
VAAEKLGWEVVGFQDGFEGLLPPGDHLILDPKSTNGIMSLGGTIIGTTNRGHFVAKVGAGEPAIVPLEIIEHARQVLNELFDYDRIAATIKARDAAGNLGSLVVVAEGARPKDGQQVKRETRDGELRLGGIGEIVAREIAQRIGKEARCCVLGHLQRGGAPTTLDRILGTRFGVKAVQLANEGHFGSMVSYQNYQVRHVPIAEAVNRLRLVPPNGEMVQTARDVEISFGD